MNQLTIISTICAVVSAIFAWAAYRFLLPKINIDINAIKEANSYIELVITVHNSGGRNVLIDDKSSFLSIKNITKKTYTKYNLNFTDPRTGSFEDVIPSRGKKLVSTFKFNYPVQLLNISIKDNSTKMSWKLNKNNLKKVNELFLEISSSHSSKVPNSRK